MILIQTCPICGSDLVDMCYPTFPPQYGKECFSCGWRSDIVQEEIRREPYHKKPSLSEELSEYMVIPCNLCNKYFSKEGFCPEEVEQCSSKEHWELLIERIKKNEKA